MDEALMSCAEYEGSQFDAVVSDGGGGGPSGRTSGTIPDVNSGIVSGNMCEHAEDALNAARDPSFTSIYSPASSYDFEYDYDLPSYNVGDMVDSPVDGDFRFWGDGAVALEYPVRPSFLFFSSFL